MIYPCCTVTASFANKSFTSAFSEDTLLFIGLYGAIDCGATVFFLVFISACYTLFACFQVHHCIVQNDYCCLKRDKNNHFWDNKALN